MKNLSLYKMLMLIGLLKISLMGATTFEEKLTPITMGWTPTKLGILAVGYLDQNKDIGLVYASGNILTVCFDACTPGYSKVQIPLDSGRVQLIRLVNVNANGKSEIYLGGTWPTFSLVWFELNNRTVGEQHIIPGVIQEVSGYNMGDIIDDFKIGDLNNDGYNDIVVCCDRSKRFVVLRGSATSQFTKDTIITTTNPGYCLALGDINGDNKIDIVAGSLYGTHISVFENRLPLGFQEHVVDSAIGVIMSVDIGDLNRDGKPDILASLYSFNRIKCFYNLGSFHFSDTSNDQWPYEPPAYGPRNVKATDLDRDGDSDIVANIGEESVCWYENTNQVFTKHPLTTIPFTSYTSFVGDGDGDGDIDIFAHNSNDYSFFWFKNNLSPNWIAPLGSKTIVSCDTTRLQWASEYSGSMRLDYSINNGESWMFIASGYFPEKSYLWIAPPTNSNSIKFRISATKDSTIRDVTNASLDLLPGTIKFDSSLNHFDLIPGSQVDIKWNTLCNPGIIQLQLKYAIEIGGFWYWYVIADSLPNSGYYLWNVPNVQTTRCVLSISSINNTIITDRTKPFPIRV